MHRKILLATAALGLLIFGPGVPSGAETPPAKPENRITGVTPNPAGDTVINRDTVWRGRKIVLGKDLIVKSGNSFTIDNCDVLFKSVWPHGKMTCENKTTIIMKDSYIHGPAEKKRASGIVFGEDNDKLTIKISGVTFKYIGPCSNWTNKMGGDGYGIPAITAKAIYSRDSYFRRCSLMCDSLPSLPNNVPGNWISAFMGGPSPPGTGIANYRYDEPADQKPGHGVKIEDCYFFRFYTTAVYVKYLYDSTLRENSFPVYVPPHHYVYEGNRFYYNFYKAFDLFNPSHHGLIKDNYLDNTTVCLADWPGAAHNLFVNNIMRGGAETCGPGGIGDGNMFIGNDMSGFAREASFLAGKDWVFAGNRISNCGNGIAMQPYPIGAKGWAKLQNARRGTVIIGNRIENCSSGSQGGAITVGMSGVWPKGVTKWKDVTIAHNEIKNGGSRGIYLYNVENAVIKNNTITGSGVGLHITGGSGCNLAGNNITGNKTDIKGEASHAGEFPQAKIISPTTNEFKKGQTVRFRGSGEVKGDKKIVSWWWFFGDDGTMSEKQNPTHTFKWDGKYFVALLVTDSEGLRDIAIMPGRIEAVWNQKDPRRPWPGKKPRLAVYPNPLYMSCNSNPTFVLYYYRGKSSLKIYDSENKLVKAFKEFRMKGSFGGKHGGTYDYRCLTEWDRKDIRPGKYIAVASDEDGEVARYKFVVK